NKPHEKMNSQNVDYPSQTRSELFTEYFTLTQIIHKYDDYCLRIKTWGVTVSGVAIGYGVREASAWVFFSAAILSFSFWMTESLFKVLQQDHLLRLTELEESLSGDSLDLPHPRIFRALSEQKNVNRQRHFWRRTMFWSHVMYPHIIFTLFGLSAGNVLIWHSFFS
ncbi:MAG: hypothetical protein AAFY76_11830, partial [Cyanobacteria bacterium J06649_11]